VTATRSGARFVPLASSSVPVEFWLVSRATAPTSTTPREVRKQGQGGPERRSSRSVPECGLTTQRHRGSRPWSSSTSGRRHAPNVLPTLGRRADDALSHRPRRGGSAMTPTPRDSGKTVLYVSTNGAGLGHITRLLALARRARAGVRPYFVSMSQAVPVVAAHGVDAEYIPSRSDLGIGTRRWNILFRRRFLDLLEQERPVAVVFDGTYPYDGLVAGRSIMPDLRFVWSRRGMWRAGSGSRQLSRSRWFDLVIEPGDFAAEADRGLTAARTDALRVSPVTLLDHAELLGREEAAAMLGTDPTRPTALVTLGTTGVANLEAGLGRLADRLSKIDDFQIVVTRSMIADNRGLVPATLRQISVYPISRALRAIDLAVAAAGYNSFHELLKFGVPSAFLPNSNAPLDDQVARAEWAERTGVGLHIEGFDDRTVDRIATELGDPGSRREFAVRCARLPQANGAGEAQCAVEDLVAGLGHGEHTC
jgi:hypothetical protein